MNRKQQIALGALFGTATATIVLLLFLDGILGYKVQRWEVIVWGGTTLIWIRVAWKAQQKNERYALIVARQDRLIKEWVDSTGDRDGIAEMNTESEKETE